METNSLEDALATLERDADATAKTLAAALRETKRVKAAAAAGQLRDVQSALDASARLADAAADAASALRRSWTFDAQDHFASGRFAAEVLELAATEGLAAFPSDDRLLSYPAIVQVSAADTTVLIDRARERRVRPSVLVKALKALQSRPPKFRAEAFLESLAAGYDLVVARAGARTGATVKLVDVYAVLTLMPGASRDYSKAEFTRDLYLLDQSGVTTTRDGRQLRLPASALTRSSGMLVTVARSGQEKVYAGVCFE